VKWQVKYYIARTGLSGEFTSEVVFTWDHYSKKCGPGNQLSCGKFVLPIQANARIVPQIGPQ
jgi:hypothetical protein